ncbi:hypothetical protein [Nannocystis pusilla]|uniref:hypothetical protein n=1 Tax=Nannocystis pusilla TaxID=889268 RepID=UPI003B779127
MHARFEPELRQAVATLAEACPEFLAVAGGASTTCGFCFQFLAYLQMYAGDRAAAIASAERVPACAPEADAAGQEAHQRAKARAFVAVHDGRPAATLVEVEQARTWTDEFRGAPWIAAEVAELELLRGRALLLLGRPAEAAEALDRAVVGFAGAGEGPTCWRRCGAPRRGRCSRGRCWPARRRTASGRPRCTRRRRRRGRR